MFKDLKDIYILNIFLVYLFLNLTIMQSDYIQTYNDIIIYCFKLISHTSHKHPEVETF